jgi:hypothetical protein
MKTRIAEGWQHFLQYDLGWTILFIIVLAIVLFVTTADFDTRKKKVKYNRELMAYYKANQIDE